MGHLIGVLAVCGIFVITGGAVFGYECRKFISTFKTVCVNEFVILWRKMKEFKCKMFKVTSNSIKVIPATK